MRTSTTDPLRIATVVPQPGRGRLGLTLCPGKRQRGARSGAWARDLAQDLDVIRSWGAALVVTLVEAWELEALQVPHLGREVEARGMAWRHLPIADGGAPDAGFEAAWARVGPEVRGLLARGRAVLVHCKGGLGRAGTVVARLLVETGWAPDAAIAEVRRVRPGAIETAAQEAHVRACRPVGQEARP
ncbi:MAG: cyclin-dependent kinase inhibitor 3 family protein [Sphingomonadaceae bacterium]|uniref:cyclin-dependent kinase inhibitor 3 family protein n=1 Tax=Thermaurantiacus sp. TaxID=2820283 RepID=UPI00298F21FD|nr:cyclin-dependent kinase inhibitor 3 family protein [Thermaurantiacus sp.]MCS6986296.1 cyclin-dependent kinase inhibitor 3 family protein [Sphingomonadaceae bacterium]MDW8415745.1 cyclin-dependent kinase inhibitor 3 family protein [Thermaurantiacus sp.]